MKLNYYIKLALGLHFLINCSYLILFIDARPEIDLSDRITIFDNKIFRIFFHGFRSFWFGLAGKTGYRTSGKFLQEKFPDDAPFPCNIEMGRSKSIPTSVHRLRPGKSSYPHTNTLFIFICIILFANNNICLKQYNNSLTCVVVIIHP